MELSKKQIERQDFVDNLIYELLLSLNPTEKHFDWDIEMIADVREIIRIWTMKNTYCSEQEYYPYIEE